jgi:hypothetical protein
MNVAKDGRIPSITRGQDNRTQLVVSKWEAGLKKWFCSRNVTSVGAPLKPSFCLAPTHPLQNRRYIIWSVTDKRTLSFGMLSSGRVGGKQ